jgi:hypothetical protein
MLAIKSRHFLVEISGGFKYADNYFCCDNYNCCCYRLFYGIRNESGYGWATLFAVIAGFACTIQAIDGRKKP